MKTTLEILDNLLILSQELVGEIEGLNFLFKASGVKAVHEQLTSETALNLERVQVSLAQSILELKELAAEESK